MNIIDVRDSIPTSNYSHNVTIKPLGICYHITADTNRGQCLSWFRNPAAKVSCHYIVERNGDIFLCVSPDKKAWHCGIVNFSTAKIVMDNRHHNPNNYLVGIEVVANGNDITTEQFIALKELTVFLSESYNIPLSRYNLIMHREIDKKRRAFDPVISYHVCEVIRGITTDKTIQRLNNKNEILKLAKEELETEILISKNKMNELVNKILKLEKELDRNTKILAKVRKYYHDIKDYYVNLLKKKKGE